MSHKIFALASLRTYTKAQPGVKYHTVACRKVNKALKLKDSLKLGRELRQTASDLGG